MEYMKRVLVVDDRMDIGNLLFEVLNDEFDVKLAYSGEEALKVSEEFRPDIILLDINLSGMSGIDTLPYLKSIVPGCRIIMLTGSTGRFVIDRAISLGASGYISKPFDIIKMKEMLKKI